MKKTIISLLAGWYALTLMAVPASQKSITYTQDDGSTVTIQRHGDEYFHWTTNAQGQWIERDEQGIYQVVPPLTDDEIHIRRQQVIRSHPNKICGLDRNLAPHGLVILVNFTDRQFRTDRNEIDSMLNGQNYERYRNPEDVNARPYAVGSARQYFKDQSYGQYSPHFEVVGPVTMDHDMAYYGGYNDARCTQMIEEACRKADDSCGVDFANYDNDNDGKADFVYVLYAGYGEADSPYDKTVWPHSSNLTYFTDLNLDGVTIDVYACSNELKYDYQTGEEQHLHNGIGTFIHEFSHVLGLPDMYDTNQGTHKTLGQWDVMDQGPYNNDGNTPPAYSAYERFFMGWVTPRIVTEQEDVKLYNLNDSAEVLLISKTGKHNLDGLSPNPTEFYLLETRAKNGWDAYLPGAGLMLTKIQYNREKWMFNSVNNKKNAMGVDIIEADGKTPINTEAGYEGKADDVYPGQSKKYKEFTLYDEYFASEIKYWTSGNTTFKLGVGKPYVGIAEVSVGKEEVIAIYDVMGKLLGTTDLQQLGHGIYLVRTLSGTKKVMQ